MVRKQVPRQLWDYGNVWATKIMQRTSNTARGLDGRTPLEEITGNTPDIKEYLDFGFYNWIWYKDNACLGKAKLGRWLGVSHRVGSLMSYWVLTKKGTVLSWTRVARLTNLVLVHLFN